MTPTLATVRADLERLEAVARNVYSQHQSGHGDEEWSLDDYLAGIGELRRAIDRADSLPPCTRARFEAEKYARNILAQRLYYRGRLCLKTGRVGCFYKKIGEKNVDWAPTELSRLADRLAAEPLRQIYKQTEACMKEHE